MTRAKIRNRVPRSARRRNLSSYAGDAFAVAVGLGTAFTVHFVGELYVSEILLVLAAFPLLLMRGRRILRRELTWIYGLMGFWLLGLVIADIYNRTPLVDRMRGSALIIFFGIGLLCLLMLLGRNDKRKILFLVGSMIGSLAAVRLQPTDVARDYPWKFGYASGTMQLVLLISTYFYIRRNHFISGMLVIGICVVNLIMNYRSPVLDLLITLVLVYPIIPTRLGTFQILPNSDIARVMVLLVLAVTAAQTARVGINLATKFGYVSEEAQEKNEAQAQAGNLLLGGRPEFAIGLQAAMDKPIIGHGSWAKDYRYYELLHDKLVESGVEEDRGDIEEDFNGLIPAHSGIITAWIWAGIFGLIFWIYIAWFTIKGILKVAIARPLFAPIYMWMLISMFWDIFFSPFAANRRLGVAFLLVVIADLLAKKSFVPAATASLVRRAARRRTLVRGGMIPAPRPR